MNKKIVGIVVCTLLIATAILPVAGTFDIDKKSAISFRFKPVLIPYSTYEPQDISLRDAAFHKSHGRYYGGWWYFEGIFDNGYSAVCGISHCSRKDRGFGTLGLHIYKNTTLIFSEKKFFTFKELEASEEFPFIEVSGKQIMRLDRERYNNTGEWVYNVSLEIENYQANLQFVGTTKGWKGEILRGWYGPVLPKADVEGRLTLNGEIINVSGLGYHEHAWDIPLTIWEWGWYWGKVVSDNFTLYWARMMNTRWWEQQPIAILTQDQDGYIATNLENFKFKATEYKFYKRRIIPTKYILNITDPDNYIYVNATMETMYFHLIFFGPIHYNRYHVKVNGEISYGSSTEIVKDQIQIVELMRFR